MKRQQNLINMLLSVYFNWSLSYRNEACRGQRKEVGRGTAGGQVGG